MRYLVAAMAAIVFTATGAVAAGAQVDAPSEREALGDNVERGPGGVWRVRLHDGRVLTTHGVDKVSSHGHRMGPGDPERAPACAAENAQHVLYGRPASAPDRLPEVKDDIQAAVRRMNAVLNEEALESGARTGDYRVLCEPSGQIAVGSFTHKGRISFVGIVNSASRAGFKSRALDYTIFFDGDLPGICGTGNFAVDERPGPENANNTGGDYGVTYEPCWNGRTPMHENGHNQGAVQTNAPDSTGTGHHCNDQHDVMCYAPDGGDRRQTEEVACLEAMHFDCGHDTYFDVLPESGEWLLDHWNLGSEANRFIELGPAPPVGGGLPIPPLP